MAEDSNNIEIIDRGSDDKHQSSVLGLAGQFESKANGGSQSSGPRVNLGSYRHGPDKSDDKGQGLGDEEKKKRLKLLGTLGRYSTKENFVDFLKKRGFDLNEKKLKTMTNDELKELLDRVKEAVNGMDGTIGYEVIMKGVEKVEEFTKGTGLDCTGLSDKLKEDKMFKNAVAQLECEYESLGSYGPETRILYSLAWNYGIISWQNTVILRAQKAFAHAQRMTGVQPSSAAGPQHINGGPNGVQNGGQPMPNGNPTNMN
jgi:hypothetical protein